LILLRLMPTSVVMQQTAGIPGSPCLLYAAALHLLS